MKPYSRVVTRKGDALRAKIVCILKTGPKTASQISQCLRECRYEDYAYWAPEDLKCALRKLKDKGVIKFLAIKFNGKFVYSLVKKVRKEKDSD